jgi:DNA-binding NtrC family response regulator
MITSPSMKATSETYDYCRFAILFVNGDAALRKYFSRLFGQRFRVMDAGSESNALSILRQKSEEIAVVLTSKPGNDGTLTMMLSEMNDLYPEIIKILSCPYATHDAVIGAVDHSGLFWHVSEPWDVPGLEVTLRRALEFYAVKRERDELLNVQRQAVG